MQRFPSFRKSIDSATENAQAASKTLLDKTNSVAAHASRGVSEASKTAAQKTTSVAEEAVRRTNEVSDALIDKTIVVATVSIDHLRSLSNTAVGKLFPECPIPMFIVPTGPNMEDYGLVFSFEEMFTNLKSGIFARPKLLAWASAEAGYDQQQLAERLRREFTRQFNESREELIGQGALNLSRLEREDERMSQQITGKAEKSMSAVLDVRGLKCSYLGGSRSSIL